jgi:branched-chain amino acid transport system ATP-binding protein
MDLVVSFADRISVLVAGALLVEGTPREVARDPRVRTAHLGGEAADRSGLHPMAAHRPRERIFQG